MSQLQIAVPVSNAATPDDPDVLALVDGTIAQRASAWTTPVYQGETISGTGTRQFIYLTDAQPRVAAVTTANVSPVLLPTKVL